MNLIGPKMTTIDHRMTRRNIFVGMAVSLICAPSIVRAGSLMPVRSLPLRSLTPKQLVPKTEGEWYRQAFYNNLERDLRAGRAMTYGPIGGKPISPAEAYQIVARARADGWLPPHIPTI